ncbi:interferon-related developmental regulator 1 isoform X1 [Cucumis sativus]|uniref:interferon-related developmental regulator 1 isoform X1 n=1 Tax=Cucumis sativus TaxID=3659 RepID=UPI0005ECF8B1|nr:interferon-related developmental regulator 1 isoform X1 [Cucumis sativus]
MGRRKTQRKNSPTVDSDDDSSVSSSSTMRSDRMSVVGIEDFHFDKDTLLDQALDALYEKRGSTREKALASIVENLGNNLQYQFVEKKFATLLHQCLNCIKKGSSKEISLASHVIGLLALTVGEGDNAREILSESIPSISQALKSGSESSKISLLECLAIITFVGGNDIEEIERSLQLMWQVVIPKLGQNVFPHAFSLVVAVRQSAAIITAMVSSWSFVLTTMDGLKLNSKDWQESISFLSSLLDKDDRAVRIAAGEALALIFEIGILEKFSAETKGSTDGSTLEGSKPREWFIHIQGLKGKILNQVKNLSMEAGGKGSAKKDLNSQRNTFRDILEFFEYGYCPETSMKIGGDLLQTSTWTQLIQLNFVKHFLGGGFVKHMQENEFLHDVFGFTPKKKFPLDSEHRISTAEKRMFKSPNSIVNKARTQHLNKQRMLVEGRNIGHYAVNVGE